MDNEVSKVGFYEQSQAHTALYSRQEIFIVRQMLRGNGLLGGCRDRKAVASYSYGTMAILQNPGKLHVAVSDNIGSCSAYSILGSGIV